MATIFNDNWRVFNKYHCTSQFEVGFIVKISNGEESFFVEVEEIKANGYIIGRVSNILVVSRQYNMDSLITFKPKHVFHLKDFKALEEQSNELTPQLIHMVHAFRADFLAKNKREATSSDWLQHVEEHNVC